MPENEQICYCPCSINIGMFKEQNKKLIKPALAILDLIDKHAYFWYSTAQFSSMVTDHTIWQWGKKSIWEPTFSLETRTYIHTFPEISYISLLCLDKLSHDEPFHTHKRETTLDYSFHHISFWTEIRYMARILHSKYIFDELKSTEWMRTATRKNVDY